MINMGKKRGYKVSELRRFVCNKLFIKGVERVGGKKITIHKNKLIFNLYKKHFNNDPLEDFLNRKINKDKTLVSVHIGKNKKKPKKDSKHKKRYYKYLRSAEWANIKIDLLAHRGAKCERCESVNRLQIHHKTYKNIFNEEPEDLEILCVSCHKEEHNIK